MRLLHVSEAGRFSLTGDLVGDDPIPSYAILSHTWGPDHEEVTFKDMENGTILEAKHGYEKMRFCGEQAQRDGLQYFWIDTCCIDKSNSTELQEAINSMFRWYYNAIKCYVYLSDVVAGENVELSELPWKSAFEQSRWFTRGWTLQELIAPKYIEFYSRDRMYLGSKASLETEISEITGVSVRALRGCPLAECTIEERFKWAKKRQTKREEDHVYSLFGIFDVTMPLVYGEGRVKAFRRFYGEVSKYTPFVGMSSKNDTQDLILLLRGAIQRLESLSATTSIAPHSGVSLQRLPNTNHSICEFTDTTLNSKATDIIGRTKGTDPQPSLLRSLILNVLSVLAAPFGYFEALQSFYPEAYTIHDIGPQVICYSFVLAEKRQEVATFTQDLLVAQTQRHWIRIKLRMTVHIGTTHWKLVAEYTPRQTSYVGWRQLPQTNISLLQDVVAEHPDVADDTVVDLSFPKSSDKTMGESAPEATSLTRILNSSVTEKARRFLESLRHQNVPMIPDTALVTAYLQGTSLVANLDNRWTLYKHVSADRSGMMNLLWREIQAAIALRGVSHAAQLAGVIIDSKQNILKGILLELPSKGPMFSLMGHLRSIKNPVPWAIRQKWAKQIVRGVAAFHERCHVIGGMRTYNFCACIDEHDDAVVMSLSQGSHPTVHGDDGLLPPECRTQAFERGDGQVGPEFDIFQLGLLLWHIYRDQNQQGHTTFCALSNCSNTTDISCEKHEDPIALPRAGTDVPDYLDQIITLCRLEDPRMRPAAWELIDMFPTDDDIQQQINRLNPEERIISTSYGNSPAPVKLTRLETVRHIYCLTLICTLCHEQAADVYYKCEDCDHGNFDICHSCFMQGKHCRDKGHLLAKFHFEAMRNEEFNHGTVHYSSVNEWGEREEIVF